MALKLIVHPDEFIKPYSRTSIIPQFLPVIGRLAADRLEGKMDESTRKRFAVDREFDEHTTYRDGAVIGTLDPDDLIGPGEDC